MFQLRVTRYAAVGLLIAGVSGCQSLDDLDRETYQRACDNLGIQRGTDSYDQCMMQQQKLDVEQSEGFMNRTNERELLKGL